MNVFELEKGAFRKYLSGSGLGLRIGQFNVVVKSKIDGVFSHIHSLYPSYEIIHEDEFVDFYIDLSTPSLARKYFRPQVTFSFDGAIPFLPLPLNQAAAMFEWGLNWCIANNSNRYLIVHAAVVEKNGIGIIFPGESGNGKSTLCAALVCNGWRLLSDEMALIDATSGLVTPVPRPVSLKNRSINLIKDAYPDVFIGAVVNDTSKGTVAHMRPPASSVNNTCEVKPLKLIFPKYSSVDSAIELAVLPKGQAFMRVAKNSFNYNVLGMAGFDAISKLVEQCDCYQFKYQRLNQALIAVEKLISNKA